MASCLLVQMRLILYIQPVCIWLSWTAQWKCAESRYHFTWDLGRLFSILIILNHAKKYKLKHYWNCSINIVCHKLQQANCSQMTVVMGITSCHSTSWPPAAARISSDRFIGWFPILELAILQIWSLGAVNKPKWITLKKSRLVMRQNISCT